ncbi:predicted protein [Nematostella vectensis]|uniref:VWFA domain-containing protein n=1 Tax=Nematostella vectensis TaxID=45351 RepID=A7RK44_NEMVE|nr:vitrin [Nematostella vectensis]EDO48100.1 predicted protein [Nematostella vectensis]|eukprot:XP_001640163.1 predicted protein [Nematostella vectensis]
MSGVVGLVFAVIVPLLALFVNRSESSPCRRRMDVAFVIDRSASMGDENFGYIKQFIKKVSHEFLLSKDSVQVGVVPFSHHYALEFGLTNYTNHKALDAAIDKIQFEGSFSMLSGALKVVQQKLFMPQLVEVKSKAKKDKPLQAVVIVGDGGNLSGSDALYESSLALKDTGKRLFVVGLGRLEYEASMRMLASEPPKTHFFNAGTGKNLKNFVKRLANSICKDICPERRRFSVTEGKDVIAAFDYQPK